MSDNPYLSPESISLSEMMERFARQASSQRGYRPVDQWDIEEPGATYVLIPDTPRVRGFKAAATWETCTVCGDATRARVSVASYANSNVDVPLHIRCEASIWPDTRADPNRHERRRRGIPRPPRDPMYADDLDEDVSTAA